jgi:hypothetical protein
MSHLRALATLSVVLAAGCGERTAPAAPAVERLEVAIAAYVEGAPEPTAEEIDALFVRLDADIAAARADAVEAEGEARITAEARARDLERRRRELMQAYVEARVARLGDAAADTVRDVGRKIGEGIEDAGRKIRESLDDAETSPPVE